ncbi:MAG: EAL domain-containing protein [Sporomusaceae bacterium]|nr:EAL domain-containing protein [Sporomusaceae bacterium]
MSSIQYNLKRLPHLSVVVVFAFFCLCIFVYFFFYTVFSEQIHRENREHTSDVAAQVSGFVANAYNISQEMALNSEVTTMDPSRQKLFLADALTRYPFIDNFFIQKTADGWQTGRAKGENQNRATRWWFQKMLKDNQPFVSKAFLTLGTETKANYPVTSIYFPVYQEQRYVGIFAADLKLEMLERFVESFNIPGRYFFVLDSEGTVVAHPERAQVDAMYNYKNATKTLAVKDKSGNVIIEQGNQKLEELPVDISAKLQEITVKALQGETGQAEYITDTGMSFLCYYQPIQLPGMSAPWVAVTVQNKDIALAPVKKFFLTTTLTALFIMIGLIFVIQRRTRALHEANLNLVTANKNLAQEQWKVSESNQQLQEINASLEEEISERVKVENELSAANMEIVAMNEEVIATNESLNDMNQSLLTEIAQRQQAEAALIFREKEYQAITSLLIQKPDDQEKLLCTILDDALLMMRAENGMIAKIDESTNTIRVAYSKGTIYKKNAKINLTKGVSGIVYSTGRMFYVEDYGVFPQRISKAKFDRITSIVSLPLKCQERVVGLFEIAWLDQPYMVTQAELAALQNFADLASVALENARTRLEMERMAYQDVLTGLPNRASLGLRLVEAMQELSGKKQGGFVMFIDIDDLKTVNDTYGHAFGDDVIREAAKRIATTSKDAFVARLGGDEFVLLQAGETEPGQVETLVKELLAVLAVDYEVGDSQIHLSSSIGIAIYPEDGTEAADILKNADNAMYAAKKAGKNCWRFYEAKMQSDTYQNMVLKTALRRAVDKGELLLHYQPQVEAATGKIVGFEALLRWYNPELGQVPPSQFIPVAEQSGQILLIGKWVLEEACRFAKELADQGFPDYKISVNVSPRQLADDTFESIVEAAVLVAQIQPRQLTLEITESGLLGCIEESSEKLRRIQAKGFGISLDDFGTGFSSLTYLRKLPVNELKMDKSFIDSIADGLAKEPLIYSVITMAHALKLIVVAEGVETEMQYEYLRSCGCDRIQGYFFSRPLPKLEILQHLEQDKES